MSGKGELEAAAEKLSKITKIKPERPRYQTYWTPCQSENGKQLKAGLYFHGTNSGDEHEDIWICSPLEAKAITRSQNGTDHGLLVELQNLDNERKEIVIERQWLAGNCEDIMRLLLDRGLIPEKTQHARLIKYLTTRKSLPRYTAANRTGWTEDRSAFVLPDQTIGNPSIIYQGPTAHAGTFKQRGEFKDWQQQVSVYCRNNPLLMLSVSASLAGPLMTFLGHEQGGVIFHFTGNSSTGKSTALQVAASVYGGPDYMASWRGTANGQESICAARCDASLQLDEIGQCEPREIGQVAYMIGNGQGKARMTRDIVARDPMRWRLVALSSGENSLAAEIAKGGGKIKAGQEVRMLNIPADRRYGLFDDLHGFDNGAKLANHLKEAVRLYYGKAGPEFVRALVNKKNSAIQDKYKEICDSPAFQVEDSLEKRAADLFALVATAGELATELNLTKWETGEATQAAATCFQMWREWRGTGGSTEARQILDAVREFVDTHGDSRFTHAREEGPAKDSKRAGWWSEWEACPFDDDAPNASRVYMFTTAGLREAGNGFDLKIVGKTLHEAGWLVKRNGYNFACPTWVGGPTRDKQTQTRAYWVAVPDED